MGLTDVQHHDFAGIQTFLHDCESSEVSSTPDEWFCQSVILVPFAEEVGSDTFILTRINPLDNELCSRFTLSDTEELE